MNQKKILFDDLESMNQELQSKLNQKTNDEYSTSRKVLLIYINQNNTQPKSNELFLKDFNQNPKLFDKKISRFFGEKSLLATPLNVLGKHTFYHIKTLHFCKQSKRCVDADDQKSKSKRKSRLEAKDAQEEVDSLVSLSNCNLWVRLAEIIHSEYDTYSGFVLFHPIQYIEYTASALSYCFENLSKPVIFTGYFYSAKPVLEQTENLFNSLFIAGNYRIPEVCILDRENLFRANRSKKKKFNRIYSPNLKPLGVMKYGRLMVDWDLVLPLPNKDQGFQKNAKFEDNIGHLIYHPFITNTEIDFYFKNANLKALVIECYGIGDLPNNNEYFLECLDNAIKRGLLIYAITQCGTGYVSNVYVNNFSSMGIESGHDFITSSILTKLSLLMGLYPNDAEQVKALMQKVTKGEMTKVLIEDSSNIKEEFNLFSEMIFENITKNNKLQNVYFSECISPAIIKRITEMDDEKIMTFFVESKIISKDFMLRYLDHAGNNILHLFASKGTKVFWEQILQKFDEEKLLELSKQQNYDGNFPLIVAITSKNFYSVKILENLLTKKQKEALINEKNKEMVSQCVLDDYLETQNHEMIKLAYFSGIKDLGFIQTQSGTFLGHLAVLKDDEELLMFLVNQGLVDCSVQDGRGVTVKALAKTLRKNNIVTFLNENSLQSSM